jgi:hypothetical protein
VTFEHYLRPVKVKDPYEYFELTPDKQYDRVLAAAVKGEPDRRKAYLPQVHS